MKTKWNFLMVIVLLATLLGGSTTAVQAQGGISAVSPMEGTVGTQVTITGGGFGEKQGEVVLGAEKSKVLAWSDTVITFLVDKAQPPESFTITVLPQGDKQPAEPMTFGAFTIRRPQVTRGSAGVIRGGDTIIILGEFFGDKKGDVALAYLDGETGVVETVKVLDWSMNTIRFELPSGLHGAFILKVRNEVGTDIAVLNLDVLQTGNYPEITDWGGVDAYENSRGIYYKGKFYVFSIHTFDGGYDTDWRIEARTFDPVTQTWAQDRLIPKGETEVPVQPLVVKEPSGIERLWVFHTGHDWGQNTCCEPIWWTTYTWDENTQTGQWADAGWQDIPGAPIDEVIAVAPVYDPRIHRISIYYNLNGYLRWVYTDDFGATWSGEGLVTPNVGLSTYPHAIYWPSSTTTALVAFRDMVIAVNNGEYRGYILSRSDNNDPTLVDLGSQIALIYGGTNMRKYNYGTRSWSEPSPAVVLPEIDPFYGWDQFVWSASGAINQVPNASGGYDRHLYILYGAEHTGYWADGHVYKWYIHDEENLGSGDGTRPPINATAFKQVSAGEKYACAINPDDTVECWGNNDDGQLNHPDGTFSQISAGERHTCGVRTDHSVECWGWDGSVQVSKHPIDANYTQVAAGLWHTCALKTDGSVACWGDDGGTGRTKPPYGATFKQITAGAWHTCGIRKDNSYAQCWGDDGGTGRTKPPANIAFLQISTASWHACGVKTDSTIACWGNNDSGKVSSVPSGIYKEVTLGNWHSCGLKTDGSIACWGSDDDGRVTSRPTSGVFTQIEAGLRNTCALRAEGGIVCWGNNSDRQSLPPF